MFTLFSSIFDGTTEFFDENRLSIMKKKEDKFDIPFILHMKKLLMFFKAITLSNYEKKKKPTNIKTVF